MIKKRIKNESGRSMLEVLSVLALIALLSILGLAGYSMALKKFRRDEAVKTVAEVVTNLQISGMAKNHEAGKVIPGYEIVQGPATVDNGQILKLTDSENSYMVVSALKNGGVALMIQAEKETWPKLIESLQDRDVTVFEESFSEEVLSYGELKARADSFVFSEQEGKLLSALSEEEKAEHVATAQRVGKAVYVLGCATGSSGVGYLYQVICNQCGSGQFVSGDGKCCDINSSKICGNLCECPGDNPVCVGNRCVECAQDTDCKTNERPYCNTATNRCVECNLNEHCPDNGVCFNHECQECNQNYDGSNPLPAGMCPSELPLCLPEGICAACPEGLIYDVARGVCACPAGTVLSPDNECVACYNVPRGSVGCNQQYPSCNEAGQTLITLPDGTQQNFKGVCVGCLQDSDCGNYVPNTYCEDMTCKQCPTSAPYWDGTRCRLCQNDVLSNAPDKGCVVGGRPLCGTEVQNGYADLCYVCQDTAQDGNQDLGCTAANKICGVKAGEKFAQTCHLCQNTGVGSVTDAGCSATTPICSEGVTALTTTGDYGSVCKKCINDKTGNQTDTGCTVDKPMCDGAEGQTGNECSNCPVGLVWSDKFGACVPCFDSVGGTGQDTGCTTARPMCKEGSGSDNVCVECVTNGNCQEKNPNSYCSNNQCHNCPSDKPYWSSKFNMCVACIDDMGGTTQDTGCTAAQPMCLEGNGANSMCVECALDENCPSNKPFCVNYTCINCRADQVYQNGRCVCTGGRVEQNGQCVCPAGKYWNNGQCTPCLAGTYKPNAGNQACSPCPSGYISAASATACTKCECGDNGARTACKNCCASTEKFSSFIPVRNHKAHPRTSDVAYAPPFKCAYELRVKGYVDDYLLITDSKGRKICTMEPDNNFYLDKKCTIPAGRGCHIYLVNDKREYERFEVTATLKKK